MELLKKRFQHPLGDQMTDIHSVSQLVQSEIPRLN